MQRTLAITRHVFPPALIVLAQLITIALFNLVARAFPGDVALLAGLAVIGLDLAWGGWFLVMLQPAQSRPLKIFALAVMAVTALGAGLIFVLAFVYVFGR